MPEQHWSVDRSLVAVMPLISGPSVTGGDKRSATLLPKRLNDYCKAECSTRGTSWRRAWNTWFRTGAF
jgi:hypothetical protein